MTEKGIKAKTMADEGFEFLVDEIPHGTSNGFDHQNHYHHLQRQCLGNHQVHVNRSFGLNDDDYVYKHPCASPMSGFSLQSEGSSLSLFSAGHSLSEDGSPSPTPLEEFKSHYPYGNPCYSNGIWVDWKNERWIDSPIWKNANESWIDELSLSRNLSRMYIGNEQEDAPNAKKLFPPGNGLQFYDHNSQRCESYDNMRRALSDYVGFHSPVSRRTSSFDGGMSTTVAGMHQDHGKGNLLGSRMSPGCIVSGEQRSKFSKKGVGRHSMTDFPLYAQSDQMKLYKEREAFDLPNSPQWTGQNSRLSHEYVPPHGQPMYNGRTIVASNNMIPQAGVQGFAIEDGFIIQGEGLNYEINSGVVHSKAHNKGTIHEIGENKLPKRRLQLDGRSQISGTCENGRGARAFSPYSLPIKCNSLAEVRGYIYLMAKDQHGCRFLQKIFDEGTPEDMQLIFSEVINHVVELIINPFGNYLMQKLLDKCTEEQRMQIILILTEEPGQLVRISFDSHGTRVVQKLIETLKTRRQISLVVSALEPGFLSLIKDSNGNHVIQHCLQCLGNDANKFIFVAAAKYCVDIATHQHGCCVLQRCIDHSTGKHRENLVAEISQNGLLLAQDPYGNYVVQFVLDLKIPSTNACLSSQFEGNYLHLSTQKCGSHVVEKCLLVFKGEGRARIIRELLSAPHFEQLLQDPHANYVVQTALRVSQGLLHNSLVEAIELHKAISRNSPYSKWIFSQKFAKK
ncbi:hypothetical protein Tsubulata_009522 [Turnera subulata]|uniref:PUM-HD domain-containing protein n=1 Tax=Turnera subulata TaxID=218843 RepID=A0A9Q0FL70_9ROSI|nr:hypothetical protein Tsubulata_009522 [Turnera subulata]